jgi:hypothetical protein
LGGSRNIDRIYNRRVVWRNEQSIEPVVVEVCKVVKAIWNVDEIAKTLEASEVLTRIFEA